MEDNDKISEDIIDIRGKNEQEIYDIYKSIAEETELQNSIWTITQNYEAAQNMYEKIKHIKEKKKN